jgi:hypothetical protein
MIIKIYILKNLNDLECLFYQQYRFWKKMYYSRKNSDNFAYFARKLNVFAL